VIGNLFRRARLSVQLIPRVLVYLVHLLLLNGQAVNIVVMAVDKTKANSAPIHRHLVPKCHFVSLGTCLQS